MDPDNFRLVGAYQGLVGAIRSHSGALGCWEHWKGSRKYIIRTLGPQCQLLVYTKGSKHTHSTYFGGRHKRGPGNRDPSRKLVLVEDQNHGPLVLSPTLESSCMHCISSKKKAHTSHSTQTKKRQARAQTRDPHLEPFTHTIYSI